MNANVLAAATAEGKSNENENVSTRDETMKQKHRPAGRKAGEERRTKNEAAAGKMIGKAQLSQGERHDTWDDYKMRMRR